MTPADLALLLVAGVGAGVIGSTAGLASLASYPALLLVGLPPVTANVTNTLGLVGSSIGSVSASRPELAGQGAFLRRWVPVAALAGLGGAALLLVSPADSFERVVPVLVALAAVLMVAAPRIRAMRPARSDRAGGIGPATAAGIVFSCAYGGYFGAAAGVLILALLLATVPQPLPVSNAVKNVLLGAANATGAVLFAITAPVAWAAVPPLLVGCFVGGRIGPPVVRRLPEAVVRWTVGVAGLALAVRLGLAAYTT